MRVTSLRRRWTPSVPVAATIVAVMLSGGQAVGTVNAIRAERAQHAALVQRVATLVQVGHDDQEWLDGRQLQVDVAAGEAVQERIASQIAALSVRLVGVQQSVTGAAVQAGDEGLVTAATTAVGTARAAAVTGSVVATRPLVEQAEAAAVAVATSVQARAAAEEAARVAAAQAAEQAAAEAAARAAAQKAAARAATPRRVTARAAAAPRSVAVSAPSSDAPPPAPAASSAWDDVRAAAAGGAGRFGLSVAWVDTTACGQSGSVSARAFSVRGCSVSHSSTIQLSFGGADPGAYQGSRSKLVSYVRAVALHESAHREIERLTGTMFPVARAEQLADAYAATYLGMPAGLASYGFTDEDVQAARAIHDGAS